MNRFLFQISKKMMLAILPLIYLLNSIVAVGQPVKSKGTDFWLNINPDFAGLSTPETFVIVRSVEPSHVTIQYTKTITFQGVPINVEEVIDLSENAAQFVDISVDRRSGIHITASTVVEVTAYFTSQQSTEVFKAIPTAVLGTEYFVIDKPAGTEFTSVAVKSTGTSILSIADGTTISIEKKDNFRGVLTYSQIDTILNKGEKLFIYGTDVSGSHIVSNKPVAVNTSYEMMPPVNTWGRLFGLASGKYRFLASEDETILSLENGITKNLNRAEYVDIVTSGAVANANKPVMLARLTSHPAWAGGLSAAIIPPLGQTINNYEFYTFFPKSDFRNYKNEINIVTPNEGINGLTLNGQPIDPTIFHPLGPLYPYSTATIEVPTETTNQFVQFISFFKISGPHPFLLTVSGTSDRDNYSYTPGQLFSKLGSITQIKFQSPFPQPSAIGQEYCIDARATNKDNEPVSGAIVKFNINGQGCFENETIDSFLITNNNGVATLCYTRYGDRFEVANATVDNFGTAAGIIWSDETPNVFYSKPTGDLNLLNNWGSLTNGCGVRPQNFGAGNIFYLANRSSYELTANWFVDGKIAVHSNNFLALKGFALATGGFILVDGETSNGFLQSTLASSLTIKGENVGDLPLDFYPKGTDKKVQIKNLALDCGACKVSIQNPLDIIEHLDVKSGTLTNSVISLKSNANNTAVVGPVGGVIETSKVTVERYLPARRAWRLLCAPINGQQTINQAWQENTNGPLPNPLPENATYNGFGTIITGGTPANGFDANNGAGYSLLKYNSSTNNWDIVPGTNNTTVGTGPYMIFTRGDRTIAANNNIVPNKTTLRATGALITGNRPMTVAANTFTAISNPFASPINFQTITKNGVGDYFYAWDPNLGGEYGVGSYVLVYAN